MSDGHVNYRDYAKRLRCSAHLERKARGLAESLDAEAKAFVEAALLMPAVVLKQVRDGPPDQAVINPFWRCSKPSVSCASTPAMRNPGFGARVPA